MTSLIVSTRAARALAAVAAATVLLLAAPDASAQGAGAQRRPPAPPPPAPSIAVRGFFDVGGTVFTAKDSFEAIFGSSSGPIYGGGGEVALRQGWFFGGRVARIAKDGQRVFVSGGEVFDLGIDTTVTITPIEFTGGYRLSAPRRRVIPYVGGGIGTYRYREESEFAAEDDDVDESFTSYHVLGGAEFRITRWLGVAGEAQWTTVPDAIGQNPGSVGAEFDETNLGGSTFRVKVVIGR
jgi:opacity protein-like surface antigen